MAHSTREGNWNIGKRSKKGQNWPEEWDKAVRYKREGREGGEETGQTITSPQKSTLG